MSSRACPVCGSLLLLWRLTDEQIGVHSLRLPVHKRGKVKTGQWCPGGGSIVPTVAAIPRQGT